MLQNKFKLMCFIISLLLILTSINYAKQSDKNLHTFQQLFRSWTTAFNNKNAEASCDFFSPNLIANYQGQPTKNYNDVCEHFKKIFSDKNYIYHYDFKIKQIYYQGNQAAIRVIWYLDIHDHKHKLIKKIKEEGLDILEKNHHGHWKIVNYLAYPTKR